jgi:hypothetical protein
VGDARGSSLSLNFTFPIHTHIHTHTHTHTCVRYAEIRSPVAGTSRAIGVIGDAVVGVTLSYLPPSEQLLQLVPPLRVECCELLPIPHRRSCAIHSHCSRWLVLTGRGWAPSAPFSIIPSIVTLESQHVRTDTVRRQQPASGTQSGNTRPLTHSHPYAHAIQPRTHQVRSEAVRLGNAPPSPLRSGSCLDIGSCETNVPLNHSVQRLDVNSYCTRSVSAKWVRVKPRAPN